MSFLVGLDNDPSDDGFYEFLQTASSSLIMWYIIISFSLMFFITILTIYYVRNIEYLIEETEVIVKKGIINRTVKHVPFRTITNVSSRYGIFDRLFGIGTCEIETAGKSGQQTGPEEKIEGIRNFRVVRDIILNELRKLRGQYATTTEISQPTQAEDVLGDVGYQKEILDELQEIKKVLLEK